MLVLGAFIAGILTTLAPCVLPLLPIIVGGSIGKPSAEARKRAYLIAASLGASVIVFTLLLKATTALIDIPALTWQLVSGIILIGLGVVSIFPKLWDAFTAKLSLQRRSNKQLVAARERGGTAGAILTGAALGPVFTSCSPLYLYVIVAVLPASFAEGVVLLLAYAIGLCGTLLLVSLLGQKVIGKARWIANPDGNFKRVLGVIFILVGVSVILGLDKDLQFWILEYSPIRLWELDKGFIPAG